MPTRRESRWTETEPAKPLELPPVVVIDSTGAPIAGWAGVTARF